MAEAFAWGALAASSLLIGALLAFARPWHDWALGLVLAFGAGALISAVSFELVEEGAQIGGAEWVGLGLALGALAYFLLDGLLARRSAGGRGRAGRAAAANAGPALALGAFLDGIPEQLVLGIGVAGVEGASLGLLVAIFVSNLPEAVGSATEMHEAGSSRSQILRLWVVVAICCTLATLIGYGMADSASGDLQGAINGFAAGALLVMLIDSMIPEARRLGGKTAGLATVIGFAVATALSAV